MIRTSHLNKKRGSQSRSPFPSMTATQSRTDLAKGGMKQQKLVYGTFCSSGGAAGLKSH